MKELQLRYLIQQCSLFIKWVLVKGGKCRRYWYGFSRSLTSIESKPPEYCENYKMLHIIKYASRFYHGIFGGWWTAQLTIKEREINRGWSEIICKINRWGHQLLPQPKFNTSRFKIRKHFAGAEKFIKSLLNN